MPGWIRSIFSLKTVLYVFFLFVFTILAAELILRIHNPFYTTLKGDKIFLPANRVLYLANGQKFSINSIGFNGEDKPKDFDKDLTIIAVGGSTTLCIALGDGNSWSILLGQQLKTEFLNVWINNAGLDGHSTFGHRFLINEFISKIKPKIVLFLIGINDIGRDDLNIWDKENQVKNTRPSSFSLWLNEHSELKNLISNLKRSRMAKDRVLVTGPIDFTKMDTVTLSEDTMQNQLKKYSDLVLQYKQRVEGLIKSCRAFNIEPILITQPLLAGGGIDSLTHVNLKTIKITTNFLGLPYNTLNGELFWRILQLYNKQTLAVAAEQNCFVIDLADKMPKNSLYFYDYCHYTKEGAKKVEEIIYNQLKPYLEEHYKEYAGKNNNT